MYAQERQPVYVPSIEPGRKDEARDIVWCCARGDGGGGWRTGGLEDWRIAGLDWQGQQSSEQAGGREEDNE